MSTQDREAVNRAFSKQSVHFDADDRNNIVLTDLRADIYHHVSALLPQPGRILELNAGTGIDAEYFSSLGHSVLATDLSDGMIACLNRRKTDPATRGRIDVRQLSFEDIAQLDESGFDLVFSNFGGLNCTDNLAKVASGAAAKVKPGGYLVWVIMPRITPWELLSVLKGNRNAWRRLSNNAVRAHLEGEYFPTWYYSLKEIRHAMPAQFEFISSIGLAAVSPPPHRDDIARKRSGLYRFLRRVDGNLRHSFPFNRWADHLIVTFRRK